MDENDAGSASKVPRTKKWGKQRGVLSTAFELEAKPIQCKGSGEGKGGVMRRVMYGPALDEKVKA